MHVVGKVVVGTTAGLIQCQQYVLLSKRTRYLECENLRVLPESMPQHTLVKIRFSDHSSVFVLPEVKKQNVFDLLETLGRFQWFVETLLQQLASSHSTRFGPPLLHLHWEKGTCHFI